MNILDRFCASALHSVMLIDSVSFQLEFFGSTVR
jgi:hypothetical protein